MVVVVNEVLVPLVDRVDKPLECLKATVFITKLLDDLLAALPSAWAMIGGRYEVASNLVCTW